MRYSIRSSLLAIALLGIATCALALYSLGRPLAMANERRTERAREAVAHEVQRLRGAEENVESGAQGAMFGLRSGLLQANEEASDITPPIDAEVLPVLRESIGRAMATNAFVRLEKTSDAGVVFVGAAPAPNGRIAWAGHLMHPPQWTPILRIVGALLVLTSIALVFVALYTVMSVRRGARSLLDALTALAKDLSAPVPTPVIGELAEVGGGIARLARELSLAQTALAERERLAVLGRVTAGVAHEIRNPLAAIKLRIEMARKSTEVSPSLATDLRDVADEVDRLNRLVTDLLTVAGRKTGPRTEVALDALVRRRISLLAAYAETRGVEMTMSGTAAALADGDAVARALDNLLRNAVEASKGGDSVRVSVDELDGDARVRVVDEGPGVDKPREHELFEPFFTTKPEGVGLGLALTKAIAEAHGGRLTYAREGATTVFELRLPQEAP